MHWLFLALAIVFEVSGTTMMKLSAGFTRWLPSLLLVVFYLCSFTSLTLALKGMNVSTAYAIWSGVGTALVVVIGFWVFGEKLSVLKVTAILFIILGVVGLHISDRQQEETAAAVSQVE